MSSQLWLQLWPSLVFFCESVWSPYVQELRAIDIPCLLCLLPGQDFPQGPAAPSNEKCASSGTHTDTSATSSFLFSSNNHLYTQSRCPLVASIFFGFFFFDSTSCSLA